MINKNIDIENFAKNQFLNYISGDPYPHIVIDNFFDEKILNNVCEEFNLNNKNKVIFNNPNEQKITLNKWDDFGPKTLKFIKYLNSEIFIEFLEKLTGIEKLLADNLLEGGGLHQINSGGYLKIHADFNKHSKTNLDRRLNALIYLNKEWKKEWGGEFEMWSKDLKRNVKKISPVFNRLVIFSTTSYSFHGHPSPLSSPNDISRKSIAMYYYTDGRPDNEIQGGLKYHSTLFKNRLNISEDRKMTFYNFIKNLKPRQIIKSLLPSKFLDSFIHKRRNK